MFSPLMAKAMNKKNAKTKKQESESSSSHGEEDANIQNKSSEDGSLSADSSCEGEIEYSQDQLSNAAKELEEVEVSESISEEAPESEDGTGSGSEAEENEDDETLRTIFIKDIDYDLKEEELTEQVQRLGEVVRVTIPLTHDQRRNKGFAYVEFKNLSDAKKGLKLDGTELLGRKISVSQARPKSNLKIFTVFVKNLSYNTKKEELEEHFGKYGKIYNISLPIDSENPERNKGFCFVEFNDEDTIKSILKAKHSLDGRTLYVNEGNKNQQRNIDRSSDRLYGRRDNERSSNGRFEREGRNNDRFEREGRNNDRFEREGRNNDRFERKDRDGGRFSREGRNNDRFEGKDRDSGKFSREGRSNDRFEKHGKSNQYQKSDRREWDNEKFSKGDRFDRNSKHNEGKFDKNKRGNKVVFDDNSD